MNKDSGLLRLGTVNEVHLNIARHLATGIPKLDVAINPSPSQRCHTAPGTHAVITLHCYGISTYGMLTQSRLTKRFGPIEAVPLRNAYDFFIPPNDHTAPNYIVRLSCSQIIIKLC